MAISLYQHNKETYAAMTALFRVQNRVCAVQPTGTGKSFLMLKWIESYPQKDFLVLAPSNGIFNQLRRYAAEADADSILANTRMVTYQALLALPAEELDTIHYDNLILDEFHHVGADMWGPRVLELIALNPDAKIFGTSATPVRYLDNSRDMGEELFGGAYARIMYLGEAVQKGILPQPTYVPVWYDRGDKLALYKERIANEKNSVRRKELEDLYDRLVRNLQNSYGAEDVFGKYITSGDGKFIVFCRDREHINDILSVMPNWMSKVTKNIRSYVSVSADSDCDKQLEAFQNDNTPDAIKLLYTIDRLNEGEHTKGITGVIMLRPTESPAVYLQQMGRALASGASSPLIFDMVNNYMSVRANYGGSGVGDYNVFEREYRDAAGDNEPFHVFDQMREFAEIIECLESALLLSLEDRWNQSFELLKLFYEEYERWPNVLDEYRGTKLGFWARNQKSLYKKGSLSEKRITLLNGIGFELEAKDLDVTWDKNFKLLVAFQEEYGRWPKKNEEYCGVKIGMWAQTNRRLWNSGGLREERIALLESVGFELEVKDLDVTWDKNFKLLVAFWDEHGRWPYSDEEYTGVRIGNWATAQKTQYKNNRLSTGRIALLEGIGFPLRVRDYNIIWRETYNLLIAFREEFGRWPKSPDVYRDVKLGKWAQKQQLQYKKGSLSEERIALLESVGFELDAKDLDVTWDKNFKLLVAFREEYGRWPKRNEEYCGVKLASWAANQKAFHKKGSLTPERVMRLEDIGFDLECSNHDFIWIKNFALLKSFYEKHGRWPEVEEKYESFNLGQWARTQRKQNQKGLLSAERIALLENIGFNLEIKDFKEAWDKSYNLVKQFHKEHGRWPKGTEIYRGVYLGRWVNHQKTKYKNGSLSAERVGRLKDIGLL